MKTITYKEQIVNFKEFRLNAQKYIDAVDKGASFLVMKRSQPIFRMEPVTEQWETLDLRDGKGNGMSADKFLKILQSNIKKAKK
jgi:antitoxin (DNA-binding transcriptional repressor) of toxin-antitoxin stability system